MAYNNSNYSYLFGEPDFSKSSDENIRPGGALDAISQTKPAPSDGSFMGSDAGKASGQAFAQGNAAGGLGSGLMGAGVTAGLMGAGPAGWAVAGGGLVLSQIEASQKAQQAEEEARIKQEEETKKQQMAAISQAIQVSRGLTV